MSKRTIAIIGSRGFPSYYGGFETLVRHLVPYLHEHDWHVLAYSRPGQTAQFEAVEGIEQVFTPGLDSKSFSTLSFGATAIASAAKRQPDVAFVMNVANGYYLPALKARSVPTVVNVDGLEWLRDKWSTPAKAMFKGGAITTARFADHLVSDSVHIAQHWYHNFERRSAFIAYGADAPQARNAELVSKELGLESGTYALLVARFVPENSVAEFIDAARSISERHPVVLVGSAPESDPLTQSAKRLAAERTNVHAVGHVADDDLLFALWSNAGCYFHGHSVGGTNPALVQAMACGAPTVARDTVFNREVLADAARFVAPVPNEISAAVSAVIENASLREDLSRKAKARAQSTYTWDKILGDYEALFRQSIGESPSSGRTVDTVPAP